MLITSDWHLTDNPADEYRWKIFQRVRRLCTKYDQKEVFILGDLTDKKDRHSAQLVNRIVSNVNWLAEQVEVHILAGNHDYIDPATPFFSFLDSLDARFYVEPELVTVDGERVLLVPNAYSIDEAVKEFEGDGLTAIFLHHTIGGAKTSNGMVLDGAAPDLSRFEVAVSGDIHVPQVCRGVTYVGSPYPVRFGDAFKPRVLLFEDGKLKSINLKSICKHKLELTSMEDLDKYDLSAGDQAKVILKLAGGERGGWVDAKKAITERLAMLDVRLDSFVVDGSATYRTQRKRLRNRKGKSTSPHKILPRFAHKEGLTEEVLEVGKRLVEQ